MLDLYYDFNNLMADRVGDHGVTESELKAMSLKIEAAAAALDQNPPAFTGADRWAVFDTPGLREGASAMKALCSKTGKLWENPAITGAVMLYLADKAKGKNIHLILSYRQETREVIEWYRRLIAESLGKRLSRTGKIVHCGQTPVSAHDPDSMMQLCIEGPYDKVMTFLTIGEPDSNTTAAEIALTKSGRPNCTLRLGRWDEETVGALMLMLEMQVAYAGELYGVNVFDQPGLEFVRQNLKEQPEKPDPLFVVRT